MQMQSIIQIAGITSLLVLPAPSIALSIDSAGPPSPTTRTDLQTTAMRLEPVYRRKMLPAPVGDPLHLDPAGDPILALANPPAQSTFRSVVAAAVERNPSLGESEADADEARGAVNEATAHMLPTLDLSLSHYEVVSRDFSVNTPNIVEASRHKRRTDALASLQQPVFDFGANLARLRAAEQRLTAARHAIEDTESQVALRAVGAWYNVFGYRALVALSTQFLASQGELRNELGRRVAQGYSAQADIVQLDSYIAATTSDIANYRRQLASAEAQFTEIIGQPPSADLERAPLPSLPYLTADAAQRDAERMPAVLAARAQARAADKDAQAARADRLPRFGVEADVGRYGVFENRRDYDARVSGTISWRLFGGASQRAEQAEARERGARARSDRVLDEARRDAAIAFTDLQGLQAGEQATRDGYIAARRWRDVTAQRFAVSRGTLFDLITADNNYYSAAARYILTLTELDTARYALLARTGTLPQALGLSRQVGLP